MKKEKMQKVRGGAGRSARERWELVTLVQVSVILILGIFTMAMAFRVIELNCEAAVYQIGAMR